MVTYPREDRRLLSNFDEVRVRLDDGVERPITELAERLAAKQPGPLQRAMASEQRQRRLAASRHGRGAREFASQVRQWQTRDGASPTVRPISSETKGNISG